MKNWVSQDSLRRRQDVVLLGGEMSNSVFSTMFRILPFYARRLFLRGTWLFYYLLFGVCCHWCIHWKRGCMGFSSGLTISSQLPASTEWKGDERLGSEFGRIGSQQAITIYDILWCARILKKFDHCNRCWRKKKAIWVGWEGQGRDGVGVGIC